MVLGPYMFSTAISGNILVCIDECCRSVWCHNTLLTFLSCPYPQFDMLSIWSPLIVADLFPPSMWAVIVCRQMQDICWDGVKCLTFWLCWSVVLQVWDLASGKVAQSIAQAHVGPIMHLLVFEVRKCKGCQRNLTVVTISISSQDYYFPPLLLQPVLSLSKFYKNTRAHKHAASCTYLHTNVSYTHLKEKNRFEYFKTNTLKAWVVCFS